MGRQLLGNYMATAISRVAFGRQLLGNSIQFARRRSTATYSGLRGGCFRHAELHVEVVVVVVVVEE